MRQKQKRYIYQNWKNVQYKINGNIDIAIEENSIPINIIVKNN